MLMNVAMVAGGIVLGAVGVLLWLRHEFKDSFG